MSTLFIVHLTAESTRVNAIKMKERNECLLERFIFDWLSSHEGRDDGMTGYPFPIGTPRDPQNEMEVSTLDANTCVSEASLSHLTNLVGV